jgi:hypothetical protein
VQELGPFEPLARLIDRRRATAAMYGVLELQVKLVG